MGYVQLYNQQYRNMREQQTNPLQSCHFVMLKCVYMYDNMVVYSPNGNWTKLIFINRDLWRLADNDFNTKWCLWD